MSTAGALPDDRPLPREPQSGVGYIPARRIGLGVVIAALLAPHWLGGPRGTGEGPGVFVIALGAAVVLVLARAMASLRAAGTERPL